MSIVESTSSPAVSWVLALRIKPGSEDAFKKISAELVAATKSEAGCEAYEWCLSEDGQLCHIYERYVDSDAVRVHLEKNAEAVGRLFALVTPESFVIYGRPDDGVKQALADSAPEYLQPLGGFSR